MSSLQDWKHPDQQPIERYPNMTATPQFELASTWHMISESLC